MRALRITAYGPPESATVEELPDPRPAEGQLVVRVAFASVNFPDVLLMADRYQISAPLPFTPGSECAGVVEAVGPGVEGFAVGDRVAATVMVGAFAERLVVAASSAWRVPDGLELRIAAAFGVTYRTAYHTLRSVAQVEPGEWVVVLGAAGGVGLATVDICRAIGARTVAAASSPEKLEVCRSQGADAVVDYSTEDLKARIKEITGRGADVVVDPVGGAYAEPALRAVRWGGRFVTVGFASGDIPRIPLNLVLLKNVAVLGFEIRSFLTERPDLARRDEDELLEMLVGGRLSPYVSAEYPLEQAADALRLVADRRATGKVLIAAG